jgi:hypothetical protein
MFAGRLSSERVCSMMRRLVVSPWGRGFALAAALALACTMQSSADPPSTDKPADKPASTDKPADAKASTAQPTVATPTTGSTTKATTDKKTAKNNKKKKRKWAPVTKKLTLDPKAPKVELFDGMHDGTINVKVVPQNSTGGAIYIENPTNKPVTVDMPDAFVAVPVLRQFGGGGGGAGGRGGGGGAGGAGGGQAMGGGGMGGMGGGMGGMGGGGMFSIPPEHTAKIPFHSVCLEHGKTDPDATMNYTVIPVTQYSNNPDLGALLSMIAKNTIDPQVAQAAAWNLASNLSWQDLANKHSPEVGFTDQLYFSSQALYQAQQLVVEARGLARERAQKAAENKSQEKKSDTKKSDDHVITGR